MWLLDLKKIALLFKFVLIISPLKYTKEEDLLFKYVIVFLAASMSTGRNGSKHCLKRTEE